MMGLGKVQPGTTTTTTVVVVVVVVESLGSEVRLLRHKLSS